MTLSIFNYSNYREFLKAYYDAQKEKNPNFSYRYFTKRAGLGSQTTLFLIMQGKRNLTKDSIPKFCKGLGLNQAEQQYFDILVSFNQAKDIESRRYYLEMMNNLRKARPGATLTPDQYEYISRWYYPVIRELVAFPTFQDNPQWIVGELGQRITLKQAKEAVDTLQKLNLIARNENGKLVQTDVNLLTEDDIANIGAYNFHQTMLSMAKEVLATTEGHEREFSGVTIAVSDRQYKEIRRRVREFEDSVLRYVADQQEVPESVFQLNFQLFSVTNGRKKHEAA